MSMLSIHARLAQELVAKESQVAAAVALLDEGATVPFIARYRKEATGGLDDTQLRLLDERLRYLRELEERREVVRKSIEEQGKLTSELAREVAEADTKTRLEDLYRPYMKKRRTKAQIAREAGLEPLALALFRGRTEGVLQLSLLLDEVDEHDKPLAERSRGELMIARRFNIEDQGRAADRWLLDTARWVWRVKLSLHLETELNLRLREQAEEEAIRVFARNLHDLLLAAPAGPRVTMGLDPGLRTGVKVAVVDATGTLVDTATISPHAPKNQWGESLHVLAQLAAKHKVELVSIGNGTASREPDKLAKDLIKRHPELKLNPVEVSEAGASVYSASELAAQEFPELDVSLRGAVSIARRLQDPLAELVKIDPKSIGVGQYQHDVSQTRIARSLDAVVEDAVNAVGVDVNTASAPLLARVAGLNGTLAGN